jgi:hypothetical protein
MGPAFASAREAEFFVMRQTSSGDGPNSMVTVGDRRMLSTTPTKNSSPAKRPGFFFVQTDIPLILRPSPFLNFC